MENEISKKDAVIDHLMSQLLLSKNASHNDSKTNDGFNNNRKPSYTNQDSAKEKRKKIVITGHSMLNGIHERGLSKQKQVKIQIFPGGTSKTILDDVHILVADRQDYIIVPVGTNDITKGINSLNSKKKIVDKIKQTSPNTKIAFSSLITRKDENDLDKKVQDVNNRLKNYCTETNFNNNIKKEQLGNKKFHLKKKGNIVFANDLLKYSRAPFSNSDFTNCFLELEVEYKLKAFNKFSSHCSFSTLKSVRRKHLSHIILAHLNINSLRNKFDNLVDQIQGNVDTLVISEAKLDESFPVGQFKVSGFTTLFRRDRNEHRGVILVFVRKYISSKLISDETLCIERMFIELNFCKKKWLLCCSYNPNKNTISDHLEILRRNLDLYSPQYENLNMIGDFNSDINQSCMKAFVNLITYPVSLRNPHVIKIHKILHA